MELEVWIDICLKIADGIKDKRGKFFLHVAELEWIVILCPELPLAIIYVFAGMILANSGLIFCYDVSQSVSDVKAIFSLLLDGDHEPTLKEL